MNHLYLAGPYSQPDPVINTRAALRVAMGLYERGLFVPHVPHLTMLWHLVCPRPIATWYGLDRLHLSRCDAIVRLPGSSHGAEAELDFAQQEGIVRLTYEDVIPPDLRLLWEGRMREQSEVDR